MADSVAAVDHGVRQFCRTTTLFKQTRRTVTPQQRRQVDRRRRMLGVGRAAIQETEEPCRGARTPSEMATILFVSCFDRQRCSVEETENETPPHLRQGFGGLAPLPTTPGVAENEPIVPTGRLHSSTPSRSSQAGTLGAYLELLRPPNVTTAVGDVLAGFAVAGLGRPWILPWLLASTMCLYAGGVVLNDVFDLEIDRVERPERPIPSGRVSRQRAAILGSALLGSGVVLACGREARRRDGCGRDGGVHPLVRRMGQTPDMGGPRQHGAVPRRQPDAGRRGGAGGPPVGVATRGTAPRLHHGGDHREPGGGPRRKTGGRQLCSDILVVRFTGAFVAQHRWRRPGGVAGGPRS